MAYQGSLFYNYQSWKDTLFIVIYNSATPDEVKKNGDVVGLYWENKLIGVNILNGNQYLKLRLSGLVHNPNEPLIALVRTLIKSSLGEDVILASSPVLVGQVKKISEKGIETDLGDGKTALCGIIEEDEELKEGDFVLLSPRGSRLDDGRMAEELLRPEQSYVIVGSEIEDIGDAKLGEETYSLEKK
jgi:hypothetical protein